ncbi:MAG: hypothetical protein WC855_02135 [Thermodesulfovibrionales bacterium]
MKKVTISGVVAAVFLGLLFFATNSLAADSYSKAKNEGKAHGPGCGSGFFDIKGECWECPDGFKHDNIFLLPTDGKVCKKEGKRDKEKGDKVGTSVAGICTEGWVDTKNWKCYKCPKGYTHDHSKHHDENGVCWKDHADQYSKANKKSGNLLCNKGFFDPIDGGTCWTCPDNFPIRTASSVKSDTACKTESCGAKNARPCLITERVPSCDSGLYENFKDNKCRTLPPGQNAWSASIDSMVDAVSQVGGTCSSVLNQGGAGVIKEFQKVPAAYSNGVPQSIKNDATLSAQSSARFGSGFACGLFPYTAGILKAVSGITNAPTRASAAAKTYSDNFEKAYGDKACSSLGLVPRPFCATVKAFSAESAGQCLNGVMQSVLGGTGGSTINKAAYLDAMEQAGNLSFSFAADAAFAGAVNTEKTKNVKRIVDFAQTLRTAVNGVAMAEDKLKKIPGCESLFK